MCRKKLSKNKAACSYVFPCNDSKLFSKTVCQAQNASHALSYSILGTILHGRNLRFTEVKEPAKGHLANKIAEFSCKCTSTSKDHDVGPIPQVYDVYTKVPRSLGLEVHA